MSNLGETPDSSNNSIGAWERTAPFTTGSASGGYTLENVTVKIGAKGGSTGNLTVKIFSDSSGSPGTEVSNITFTGPNSPANQDATYTCAGSGCNLDAGKTYHLHVSQGGGGYYEWKHTASDGETQVPSTGNAWSIGDIGHLRVGGTGWSAHSSGHVGMFKVVATER